MRYGRCAGAARLFLQVEREGSLHVTAQSVAAHTASQLCESLSAAGQDARKEWRTHIAAQRVTAWTRVRPNPHWSAPARQDANI